MSKIPLEYFRENDTLLVAADLLGKLLVTRSSDGVITSGLITETEAYLGVTDRASHAYNNRCTQRTSVMYLAGGVAYVYMCYGIHFLFNVVTEKENIPNAVLIRGIKAVQGIDLMTKRLPNVGHNREIYQGPGKLTKALGIDLTYNREILTGNRVWVENTNVRISPEYVKTSKRVGVEYAGEDAKLPYRFYTDPANI